MMTRGVVPIAPGCGGAELVAYQLARSLASQGHSVTLLSEAVDIDIRDLPTLDVVAPDPGPRDLAQRLPGRFPRLLGEHLAGNLAVVATARRLTSERRYDYVHAHGNLSAILVSLACDLPVVYTEHDAPPWLCRYRSWWERWIRTAIYRVLNVTAFHCADAVGATFRSLQEDMVDHWEVAERKVHTIVNGADLDSLQAPPAPVALEAQAPEIPFESFCLFVGRLTPRKAPDLLLRALADAPGVCCVFAGDGPLRGKLEALAAELGVASRVTFLGNVSRARLPELYARAGLLVLPSVSEAMPLAVLEAMACGTPALATRIAGVPTLVEDWESGFLIQPGDVGELSVALRFLMHDHTLRASMGERARVKVATGFVWPQVAGEYERLYRSVGAATTNARPRRKATPPIPALV
jgi:glycosyltransferase involved in cell wall biosynthesis